MMKNILVFLAFALLPAVAVAQPEPTMSTSETLASTATIRGVSISNSAATSVIVSTGAFARGVAIENVDSSAILYCGYNSGVAASSGGGWEIFAGQSVWFALPPASQFYCISGGSGATEAEVMLGR